MNIWKWKLRRTKKKVRPNELTVHSYPGLLYAWPLVLIGYILWPLDAYNVVDPIVLAWVYAFVTTLVVMAMGVDVDRNQTIFWVVLVALIVVSGLYLRALEWINPLGIAYDFLVSLAPKYSRGVGLIISMILSISYVFMLILARFNDRWVISHNAFEHVSMGSTDNRVQRAGHNVRFTMGDYLEALLGFGAGTLDITDLRGNVVRRLRNVPGLFFRQDDIRYIVERTAVTELDEEEAAIADQSFESSEAVEAGSAEDEVN